MALTYEQDEFLERLNKAFVDEDWSKEPSNWGKSFLEDNLKRYDEKGLDAFYSPAQWKWIHIIAEENYGIKKEDYE